MPFKIDKKESSSRLGSESLRPVKPVQPPLSSPEALPLDHEDSIVPISKKAAFFLQVILPTSLAVMVLFIFIIFGLVTLLKNAQEPSNSCAAHCHPHVSRLIENQCHCAVDDGWLKHVEDVTEITHRDPK